MRKLAILLAILLCLPMTKAQMIRRIRCQSPEYTYEELISLPESALRNMLWPGV